MTMKDQPIKNIKDLGLIAYHDGIKTQNKLLKDVQDGKIPNTILLMEHFPVLTKGRISDPKDIFFSAKDSLNLEIVETDRGGQITFHGPGQLIAYPIINIKSWA